MESSNIDNRRLKMTIEFGKLYFGATFVDPESKLRFVKYDEGNAVWEDDEEDNLASFDQDELV
jgi:hypothetical protein